MNELEKKEAINLLKMLVETNTVNPCGNELILVKKIIDYLSDTNAIIKINEIAKNRASLIAYIKGKDPTTPLILCGHMDTVPYGKEDLWLYPPNKLTKISNRYYGRGTSDMKSGLAVMLYNFKKFAKLNKVPENDIIFVATADEESIGLGANSLLSEIPLEQSTMIIAEPTNNKLGIASNGTLWLNFKIYGKSAHGAYPEKGVNAIDVGIQIYSMIKIFCEKYQNDFYGKTSCAITNLSGGTKINMIPDFCSMDLDIRTIPIVNNDTILEKISSICYALKNNMSNLKVDYNIINNRPSVSIDKNHPFVLKLSNIILNNTKKRAECAIIKYFSDASIFVKKNQKFNCLLFGPGKAENAHITNEYVEEKDFFTSIDCYNDLLLDYFF